MYTRIMAGQITPNEQAVRQMRSHMSRFYRYRRLRFQTGFPTYLLYALT